MQANGSLELNGQLSHQVIRTPRRGGVWWWHLKNWILYRWREIPLTLFLFCLPLIRRLIPGLNVMCGATYLMVRHADGSLTEYGLVGRHLITTAGKKYVASTFANTAEPEVLKYHGYGTGTTAANVADTTLVTELTTQYATDNTRPTGSQSSDGTVTTYTTVATLSPDTGGTIAVTEWGLFSQAATGGGTLWDRQVFSAVNLVAGSDSLQSTYVLTIA